MINMMTNEVGTCSWLVEELVAARIVERARIEPYFAEFIGDSPYADAEAFSRHLAREGILTFFQAKRAVDGDAKKLVLGPYLMVEVIGNGSLGLVYRALGRADNRSYAVKLIPQRAWSVRLARQQVKAFEQLPLDAGIVPLVDIGTAHGLHYLVWSFVEGRTLENIIPECGPLHPGEVARLGMEVAEALRLCHPRGLIHGLIKPSNVIVTPEGRVRLLDFGIGALLAENSDDALVDTVSRTEALGRMLECCSPESVVDSSQWTPASDQYSLGCTLYFAAAGRYPFPAGTFVEKIFAHQNFRPVPIRTLNPDIPPGLADVIDRLMQKSPSDRYRKLDELIRELAPLLTASRIHPPAPVNVETPPPRGRLSGLSAQPQCHARSKRQMPEDEIPKQIEPVSASEPPPIALSLNSPKSGVLGRLFGSSRRPEKICATVVAAGPAHPGETAILHVYVHGPDDARALEDTLPDLAEKPRILGSCQSQRAITVGSQVGLHLSIAGAYVAEPLHEFARTVGAELRRFAFSLAADVSLRPLSGRLMVGQDGVLLAEANFTMPVEPALR